MLSAGSLDPTFGSGGKVITDFTAADDHGNAVAVQADGKIVVAGYAHRAGSTSESGIPDFALVRYNSDGSLDTGFGAGGKVVTAFSYASHARAVAIQADGKIVAAGSAVGGKGYDFALARYNPNGTLDTSFDGDGKLTTDFGAGDGVAYAIAIQSDGLIVAAGSAAGRNGADFALVRYNANGSLDKTFNKTGKLTTDFAGGGDVARSVVVQADGKVVAAGLASMPGAGYDFAVARYNANGALDKGFDGDGKLTTDFGSDDDRANGVAIQPDFKIVAAGHTASAFALARYNANGSLDTAFDGDGRVTTDFGPGWSEARAVVIQTDGKIVAAGFATVVDSTAGDDLALARYNPDGSPDAAFGSGGLVTTDIAGSNDGARGIALQADGKIIAAGTGYTQRGDGKWQRDMVVAQYLPTAPQIGSFAATPNPVSSGDAVTLTASNVSAFNPGSTVAHVAFYRDSNGDGILDPASDALLGYDAQASDGEWTFTFTFTFSTSSAYKLFAQALDSYGVLSDPLALDLEVL